MDTRQELHRLVDGLPDEHVAEAVRYIRELVSEDGLRQNGSADGSAQSVQPAMTSGRDFFTDRSFDLAALAIQQGVQPVTRFDDLLGDFWPEDETADEFVAAVRGWRREGGCA